MRGAKEAVISAASFLVFAFLDLLDFCLCFLYMFVDSVLEDNPAPCCCRNRGAGEQGIHGVGHEGNGEISETLYERRSMFRLQAVLCSNKEEGVCAKEKKKCVCRFPRWSDCRCETCFSLVDWTRKKPKMLYFVLKETNPVTWSPSKLIRLCLALGLASGAVEKGSERHRDDRQEVGGSVHRRRNHGDHNMKAGRKTPLKQAASKAWGSVPLYVGFQRIVLSTIMEVTI